MSTLSETLEMAHSRCGFGSNPPKRLLQHGCEIILPSHCMCSVTVPQTLGLCPGLSRPCEWLVRTAGTSGRAPGRTRPSATPHPVEQRGTCRPEAGNREKVPSHRWQWPLQAPASKAGRCLLARVGSKSLTLELTKFIERVVGDNHDHS